MQANMKLVELKRKKEKEGMRQDDGEKREKGRRGEVGGRAVVEAVTEGVPTARWTRPRLVHHSALNTD